MKQELDELLCKKYPKMMVNRYKPMTETCMCWGFACGNGWFNILNQLMGNIQHHIDWKRKQRAMALKYNRALKRAINGDKAGLIRYYTYGPTPTDYTYESVERDIKQAKFRDVPDIVPQVTLDQVKEKFGTLRFYYTGGDDYISGMVSLAESMSGVTCEGCGNVGERSGEGWIRTICASCDEKRKEERARSLAEYHKIDEPK
jgi:hypothetical protein